MKKILSLMIFMTVLASNATTFAGSNHITAFKGTLKYVALVASDNTEYPVLSGNHDFTLGTEINLHVEAGPSKTVPYGDYKGIKYVFANNFSVTGYVELTNSGADNGRYYTNGGGMGGPAFIKDGAPNTYNYSYDTADDGNDYGWCTVNITASDYTTNQKKTFTLSETAGTTIHIQLVLEWLWFGGTWSNFDETTNIVYGSYQGGTEFFYLDGGVLYAPWIDPPEFHLVQ